MKLDRFGFTPTEGRVYAALLGMGTATGYAVAQKIGVARANVYQALEGLVRRGAARRSATIPAQYAALPPASLLTELERTFRRDLDQLEEDLRALPIAEAAQTAAGLEAMSAADDLLRRAAACADGARSELLAVTGPWAPPLNEAIARARRRGVTVRAVFLGDAEIEGARTRPVAPADLTAYWGGSPVAVAADRQRAAFGVVTADGIASGVVTEFSGVVPFIHHLLRRETAAGG